MNALELLDIISTGETSKVQFKGELPHRDSVAKGEIYVKQGSNKCLLTDNAEIMRLFQHSGNLLADWIFR